MFVISCVSLPTFYLFLFYGFSSIAQTIERRIVALFLIFLRGVLSTGVACSTSGSSTLKLLIVLAISISIIYDCLIEFKRSGNEPKFIRQFLSFSAALSVYMIIESLFFSGYPLVSVLKWVMYVIPFCACVLGCYRIRFVFDLVRLMTVAMCVCLIVGLPLIASPLGYLRNGHAFQGVFNHPNVYGVLIVAFVALVLTRNLTGRGNKFELLLIPFSIWLETLSESRTGMIGIAGCLLVYMLSLRRLSKPVIVTICIALSLTLVAVLFAVNNGLVSNIADYWLSFFSKGRSGINVDSRTSQIVSSLSSFNASPLVGTGFMVPFDGLVEKHMIISMDLVVEPGNIFLSILGYCGLLGSLLMALYYGWLIVACEGKYRCLMLAPFLISLGEMTFFSTNNCGLFCYLMMGAALASCSAVPSREAQTINGNDCVVRAKHLGNSF